MVSSSLLSPMSLSWLIELLYYSLTPILTCVVCLIRLSVHSLAVFTDLTLKDVLTLTENNYTYMKGVRILNEGCTCIRWGCTDISHLVYFIDKRILSMMQAYKHYNKSVVLLILIKILTNHVITQAYCSRTHLHHKNICDTYYSNSCVTFFHFLLNQRLPPAWLQTCPRHTERRYSKRQMSH